MLIPKVIKPEKSTVIFLLTYMLNVNKKQHTIEIVIYVTFNSPPMAMAEVKLWDHDVIEEK